VNGKSPTPAHDRVVQLERWVRKGYKARRHGTPRKAGLVLVSWQRECWLLGWDVAEDDVSGRNGGRN